VAAGPAGTYVVNEIAMPVANAAGAAARPVADLAVSLVPVVGDLKDVQELVTGKNLVTGQRLTAFDRGVTAVAALLPIVSGPIARGVAKGGAELLDEAVEVGADLAGGGGRCGRRAAQAAETAENAARVRSPTDRLKEQLFERPGKAKSQTTLDAARRELAGESTGFDHVTKVRNAQRGLRNRIEKIKRLLGDPGLSEAGREALLTELGSASRLLDQTKGFVP